MVYKKLSSYFRPNDQFFVFSGTHCSLECCLKGIMDYNMCNIEHRCLQQCCSETETGIYCIRHIFRESNFSRIGTLRHFREWLNSRSRRAMYSIHKSHSCVGIGGKYLRVLINSRIAPDSRNSRK